MPSRDSSVWRSLAVAFGDGLAFGVGMKLTQSGAPRPAVTTSLEADLEPLADRLRQIELRLAHVEQAPAPLPAPPAPFDRKVLEAVVNALEARLQEQAGQVEQRLAELESKIAAELKALRQQDHSIVSAVERHLEEMQEKFGNQVAAIRVQLELDQAGLRKEVASEAASAVRNGIEESLAPLRRQDAEKDRQITDLRQRVDEADSVMLEFLDGMGELLRRAATRRTPPPAAPDDQPAEPKPVAEAAEPPDSPDETAAASGSEGENPLPAFAQPGKPGQLWRVPLVSSMAIATFGMAGAMIMVRYL